MNTLLKTTMSDKQNIEHLNGCIDILKDHLEYLRDKIKEKDEQIEMLSDVVLALDDEIKRKKTTFFDLKHVSLN